MCLNGVLLPSTRIKVSSTSDGSPGLISLLLVSPALAGQEKRVEASIAYFCSASLRLNHGHRKRAGCGRSLQLWVDAGPLSRDKAALLGSFMQWVRLLHSGRRANVGKAAACNQLAFHITKRQKEICWRLNVWMYVSLHVFVGVLQDTYRI